MKSFPGERDRVRAHTPQGVNAEIDRRGLDGVNAYAARTDADIQRRVSELSREWDMERILQLNASMAAITGLGLAAWKGKRWLALPVTVFSFFLQHAIQGWCPPVPVFRRLGVRTRPEINREKYALKALRGDFEAMNRLETAAPSSNRQGDPAGRLRSEQQIHRDEGSDQRQSRT